MRDLYQYNVATPYEGVPELSFRFPIDNIVPQDKMLVIGSASVRVDVPHGQEVIAELAGNSPFGVGLQYMVLTRQGTFNNTDIFTANHSMLLWVNHWGAVFTVQRSSTTGVMHASLSFSGYFES